MDFVDEKIVNIVERYSNEQEKKDKWEDRLSKIVEEIPTLQVTCEGMDMEMVKHTLLDNKLLLYLPNDFKKMAESQVKAKYPHEARPQIIFCNKPNTINVGLSLIKEETQDEDIIPLRDIMKNANLSVSPSSSVLDEGDFLQEDDRPVAYYAFTSFAIGGQMYNVLFITVFFGKLLVVNMNCLKKDMEDLKLLFYGIMKTAMILDGQKGGSSNVG